MSTPTHCVALGICTVLLLPPILATLLGWNPPLPHRDDGSIRLLASAAAAAYTAVLTEVAPRLAGAPEIVVTPCSYAALVLAVVAVALGVAYLRAPSTS
ncbi:hypothetical protein [Streptomyces phaeochromogenes]|uniref:hypothetical protein n=1 Tax=Streptomyces phaeochromogenes TaxID=1923 RepID=UPI00386380CC|nr:hypothetical protein OG277_15660 [Streptomyces phaeochromogenes]